MFENFYRLVDGKVVPCESLEDFEEAFTNRWHKTTKVGEKTVSTIFLALDHDFSGKGPPVVFETMVFPDQDICKRYCTLDEAKKGHKEVVEKCRHT